MKITALNITYFPREAELRAAYTLELESDPKDARKKSAIVSSGGDPPSLSVALEELGQAILEESERHQS